MRNVKEIHINAKGKSEEEIKAEIMKEIEKGLDETIKTDTKSKGRKPAKLDIQAVEDKKRKGYDCHVTVEGRIGDLIKMSSCVLTMLAQSIAEKTDGKSSPVEIITDIMMGTVPLLFGGDEE